MAKFRIEELDEGVLEGYITINGIEIEANLDLENPKATIDDYKDLITQTERFADYFTAEKQQDLVEAVAEEVVDSALEQSDEKATADDYKSLQNDMRLIDVYAFEDGFVLTYKSDNNFPNNDIIVQIDEDCTIDDIVVEDAGDDDYEE